LDMGDKHRRHSASMRRRGVFLKFGTSVILLTPGLLWTAVIVLVGIGLVGTSLLKVWRVTPEGFVPVIRVSWLDMVQARTLANAAREHMAAGRLREAAHSWRGAVANNPVHVPHLREWVTAAVESDDRFMEDGGAPLNQAIMLVHMGGTNVADIELTMRLLWRMGRKIDMVQLGLPFQDKLGPTAAGLMVRTYFEAGEVGGFDKVWQTHAKDFEADRELALYREAWKAQWGPASTAREGMERLTKAQSDPAQRPLALELARRLAAARSDIAEHERLMAVMIQEGSGTIQAHAERWMLLASQGRRDEALLMARSSSPALACKSADQTRTLAETLARLGLVQEAVDVLKRRPATQMRDVQLWVMQGKLHELLGQWDDLAALALAARSIPGMGTLMDEVSYAMEAVAKAKQLRPDAAELAAGRAAQAPLGDLLASPKAAAWLVDAGFAKAALSVLKKTEPSPKEALGYWAQRMMTAAMAKDADEMVLASERSMALAPGNPVVANNHAATLVVTGRQPAEAVKLTFENLAKFPNSPDFQVNHAMALLQNNRRNEARAVLLRVDSSPLNATQRANFHLAWLELEVQEGKWSQARERGILIDRTQLIPLQIAKLDAMRALVSGIK